MVRGCRLGWLHLPIIKKRKKKKKICGELRRSVLGKFRHVYPPKKKRATPTSQLVKTDMSLPCLSWSCFLPLRVVPFPSCVLSQAEKKKRKRERGYGAQHHPSFMALPGAISLKRSRARVFVPGCRCHCARARVCLWRLSRRQRSRRVAPPLLFSCAQIKHFNIRSTVITQSIGPPADTSTLPHN